MEGKYLSKWKLRELKEFAREHGPIFLIRDSRTGKLNKRSYYLGVKRHIQRLKGKPLSKLKFGELVALVEAENLLEYLPRRGSGRRGLYIKKDYYLAIKKFRKGELEFDEEVINGGRHLRKRTMTVPLGHRREKDLNKFFEGAKPKIIEKLSLDLQELGDFKFFIYVWF